MKIELITIGKSEDKYIIDTLNKFLKKLSFYVSFTMSEIVPSSSSLKSSSDISFIKEIEGDYILKKVSTSDYLILLDERGTKFSSQKFANFIEKKSLSSLKSMIFVIGGAYGFSEKVYKRADDLISLSEMTFNHQLIRVMFLEQIYRAFTIIKGEPYHHK